MNPIATLPAEPEFHRAFRPSSYGRQPRYVPDRPGDDRVALLAARYAAGQDLWTGKTLRGQDAGDWVALQFGQMEVSAAAC